MTELWQLYDEQGRAVEGSGAIIADVCNHALLHGASHVWIWRKSDDGLEILLQKRAGGERTWPHLLDSSSAGHIDIGESPLSAAIREAKEELGITVPEDKCIFIGATRSVMSDLKVCKENELCWLYSYQLAENDVVQLNDGEVEAVIWKSIDLIKQECSNAALYVPHGQTYYYMIFEAIERQAKELLS